MSVIRRLVLLLLFCSVIWTVLALDRDFGVSRKPYYGAYSPLEVPRADSLTGFDVQKYEITLAIDQATHQITGNVLATVLAEAQLSSLQYNLLGLTVSSVLVNGSPATFTHNGGLISIDLNISESQTFTTQVFYSGIPQLSPDVYHIGMIFGTNTVFTISDPDAARYWWPCYDHPWDKALVDLHITLRSDWKVAANGIRTGIIDNGNGTSTTHWVGSNPMTTYLVCITCGPYVEINQTAGTIPIQNFVMQSQYNNALVDFANLPAMVNYYSQVFGPYPFEKYGNTVVSMSTYGAMEHQTITTLGNYIITGNGTYELTIAHELAHQWYGDAVSFLTFKDVWLSEGFATYSELLWTDHRFGWPSAAAYVASAYHQYYLNWESSNGPQTIYNPSYNSYFSPPSYEKAASVLHMLRLKIGNANFFQLLHDWFLANDNGNVITAEFQAMAEQISGMDLDQFFQQWIYSSGIPELKYSVWNNDASDSPLKIIAQTVSNTTTPFQIEVPFRFVDGTFTDSLYVSASPSGQINHFWHSFTANSVLTPNYHDWTLLRSSTELKPVLAQCLPSNSVVRLWWSAFLDDPSLTYNVYRRTVGGAPAWQLLNPEPLPVFAFTDLTAQNGTAYQYAITAVDQGGWESMRSPEMNATPVAFSFANDLLVVDETRDGNGANINPNDAMVDDFYAAALTPISYQTWDCAAQGLPPLDVLGQNRLVLWHADDFSQNLLLDHLNIIGGYLLGGGKLLISGWKTASVLSAFLQNYGGVTGDFYNNSPCLISAQSTEYAELVVDPLKLIASWNGMLPYIYTFTTTAETLYTGNLAAGSAGDDYCIAFRKHDPETSSDLVYFGFPLYFMQAAGVRSFLQEIIPDLLSPVANQDLVIPPVVASLSAWPNPFNPETTIRYNLPEQGKVRLAIYNLKGQLLRTLDSGSKNAGEHSLDFDGRDAQGNFLSSGIYILRLEHAGKIVSKRLSLIK